MHINCSADSFNVGLLKYFQRPWHVWPKRFVKVALKFWINIIWASEGATLDITSRSWPLYSDPVWLFSFPSRIKQHTIEIDTEKISISITGIFLGCRGIGFKYSAVQYNWLWNSSNFRPRLRDIYHIARSRNYNTQYKRVLSYIYIFRELEPMTFLLFGRTGAHRRQSFDNEILSDR